jgi:hypothetical protein
MHSLNDASDLATRAGALALTALFDQGIRKDRAVLESIMATAQSVEPKLRDALQLYLDDPIGVREWPMSAQAIFGSHPPPYASPAAIARIREARVAAAYGLRQCAMLSLSQSLRMPHERSEQINTALAIYERGVLATVSFETGDATVRKDETEETALESEEIASVLNGHAHESPSEALRSAEDEVQAMTALGPESGAREAVAATEAAPPELPAQDQTKLPAKRRSKAKPKAEAKAKADSSAKKKVSRAAKAKADSATKADTH